MRSLITIDVEGTIAPSGINTKDPFESVDVLDTHLQKIEEPVTLFVTPAVIENRTEVVQRWKAEDLTVGLHIHPAQHPNGNSDWLTDYTGAEIRRLLTEGCEIFESRLGTNPTRFRAGRWEYSDRLLYALRDHGFQYDSSLRPEDPTTPYCRDGICEVPLTVYSNIFLRNILWYKGKSSVPLHADAFLKKEIIRHGFKCLVHRVMKSSLPYIMISYHDYDILEKKVNRRTLSIVEYIQSTSDPVAI
jgi:hypothetical protein